MPAPATLVWEVTSATAGPYSLATVARSFNDAFGTGGTDTFDCFMYNRDVAGEWMHATGHLSDATTLVLDTVIEGSNGTSEVAWSAGTKDVTNDIGAAFQFRTDATAKTTPIDADSVPLVDSAASNAAKRVTWANIKATLKTYFDALYIGEVLDDTSPQLGGNLDLNGHWLSGDGDNEGIYIDGAGNVGIGVGSPLGRLHIYTGASGASSANALANTLVIEHNAAGGLSILTPSAHAGYLVFGDEVSNASGWIKYDNADDSMRLYAAGAERLSIIGGNVTVANDLAVTGALSKGSGSFLIDHPIDPLNKDLKHGFVEAPRYDLLYRGVATLVGGQAVVHIDADSRMTDGTFAALTQNAIVQSLQNCTGYDRVKASAVVDGKFTITCEDAASTDEVAWMVLAERADAFIKWAPGAWTDDDGRLVPERDKEDT